MESPILAKQAFVRIFALLSCAYALWLIALWPGPLGEDSLAIIWAIEKPGIFFTAKSALWHYFVGATYGPTGLVEVPIALQLLFMAAVCARLLAWQWSNGLRKTSIALLVLVCLAPHAIYYTAILYPDGIFAVATTGLMFELWLICKERTLTRASVLMVAITMPISVFARENGIVFLIPVALVLFALGPRNRKWLAIIIAVWCTLIGIATYVHRTNTHGTLYPLAIFETTGFLRPHPMKMWVAEPKVSPRTVEILTQHRPLEQILSYYDADYWDPLVRDPEGPRLLEIPPVQQEEIVREFFRYNLWRNLPGFVSSRVNVFLVSALGEGASPALGYTPYILAQTKSKSVFRRFQFDQAAQALVDLQDLSYKYRRILWSPLPSLAMLLWILLRGWQRRDMPALIVALPLLAQAAGIFAFSIAGEYRYLLIFFFAPLVLIPIIRDLRSRPLAT